MPESILPITKVSKELEPLAVEARKYGSAEEFITALKDKGENRLTLIAESVKKTGKKFEEGGDALDARLASEFPERFKAIQKREAEFNKIFLALKKGGAKYKNTG